MHNKKRIFAVLLGATFFALSNGVMADDGTGQAQPPVRLVDDGGESGAPPSATFADDGGESGSPPSF